MKAKRSLRERYVNLVFRGVSHPSGYMAKMENCLWNFILGNNQMKGYYFQRKCPVLHYTAPFLCSQLKLIIEIIDRPAEAEKMNSSKHAILRNTGFEILQFTTIEIKMKTREVRNVIEKRITELEGSIQPSAVSAPSSFEILIKHKIQPEFQRSRLIHEPAAWY